MAGFNATHVFQIKIERLAGRQGQLVVYICVVCQCLFANGWAACAMSLIVGVKPYFLGGFIVFHLSVRCMNHISFDVIVNSLFFQWNNFFFLVSLFQTVYHLV